MFYAACVENRQDPLKLGRCQVRVVNLHNPDKSQLPTEDLPWAIPCQPITSAAMNGIGSTPIGPVEGTWCIVFFRDDAQQHPIILGTLGGIPSNPFEMGKNLTTISSNILPENVSAENILKPKEPNISINPLEQTQPNGKPSLDITKYLTQEDLNILKATIAQIESKNNYKVVNTFGYLGKYQFGAAALTDIGYVRKGTSNRNLTNSVSWTSLGPTSKDSFLATPSFQETAMDKYLALNFRRLVRLNVLGNNEVTDKRIIAGYLGVSHNQGCGAALKIKNGKDSKDGYGTSATSYYKKCYDCLVLKTIPQNDIQKPIGTKSTEVENSVVSTGNTSLSNGISDVGFHDPDNVYPLFLGEPDTNRLARAENIAQTIVAEKDFLSVKDIQVARTFSRSGGAGSDSEFDDLNATDIPESEEKPNDPTNVNPQKWDQPSSPYNAQYPYNHVYESESGHVLEFDDTPDNERIHLYHNTGTFIEIDSNGTQVNRIVGDSYEIVDRNGYINIRGSCNITVEGHSNILTKGHTNIESYGNMNFYGHNDVSIDCSGNMSLNARGSMSLKASNITMEAYFKPHMGPGSPSGGGGQINIKGRKGVSIDAEQEKIQIRGKKQVNIASNLGDVSIKSTTAFLVNASSIVLNSNGFSLGGGVGSDVSSSLTWNDGVFNFEAETLNLKGGGLNIMFGGIASQPHPRDWGDLTSLTLSSQPVKKITPEIENVALSGLKVPPSSIAVDSSKWKQPKPIADPDRINEYDMGYENQEEYSSEEVSKEYYNDQISNGKLSEPGYELIDRGSDTKLSDSGKTNANNTTSTIKNGEQSLAQFKEFLPNTQLSTNFKLGDVIKPGHNLVDQQGLTVKQIVQNLKFMCENVLEKIIINSDYDKTKLLITSGYRQIGVVANSAAKSKHHEGLALDLKIKGGTRKDHYEFAIKLKQEMGISFDKILLEYRGNNSVWVHIQCNIVKSGNNFVLNNRGLWDTYLDDRVLNKVVNGELLNGTGKFIYLK